MQEYQNFILIEVICRNKLSILHLIVVLVKLLFSIYCICRIFSTIFFSILISGLTGPYVTPSRYACTCVALVLVLSFAMYILNNILIGTLKSFILSWLFTLIIIISSVNESWLFIVLLPILKLLSTTRVSHIHTPQPEEGHTNFYIFFPRACSRIQKLRSFT